MQRHKLSGALVGLALLLAACSASAAGSTGTTSPATTAAGTTATTSGPATTATTDTINPRYPNGLRGVRYCEVLLLHPGGGGIVADVWNTMGHSDCPQDAWQQLDGAAIAADNQALVALLNGPRYWTLDRIQSKMQNGAPVKSFGTIEMFLAATVNLGTKVPDQTPYTQRQVVRDTVFSFDAGSEIYELTDPDGNHYVMQSYSQTVDPTMDASRLPTLGESLALPDGWTYDVITLDEQLDVYSNDGIAVVVQDDLQNTYQLIDLPPV